MTTEMPAQTEEKKLATWGTDIPDDLVLDEKLLAEALKKVYWLDLLSNVLSPSACTNNKYFLYCERTGVTVT